MLPAIIHVSPRDGGWAVQPADRDVPVSTHPTADEAERAAEAIADERGGVVVLRDRYSRVHEVHVAPPAVGAGRG